MSVRFLTALPVYNEEKHVNGVLDEVCRYSHDVLVVDDGSADGTAELLRRRGDVEVERHAGNLGYGAALRTAFRYAIRNDFQVIVTVDCDGQHQPRRIPRFVEACEEADIVSGSRYLNESSSDGVVPADRKRINQLITAELNERLDLQLTDAFCGFKGYRVAALRKLRLTENGYAMPLELWVQAARLRLRVRELAVPLIYLEEARSFGGALDDATTRLEHYRDVMRRSLAAVAGGASRAPAEALCEEGAGCR